MITILPRTAAGQPFNQGIRGLDRSNRITRGLVFAFGGNGNSGAYTNSPAGATAPRFVGSGQSASGPRMQGQARRRGRNCIWSMPQAADNTGLWCYSARCGGDASGRVAVAAGSDFSYFALVTRYQFGSGSGNPGHWRTNTFPDGNTFLAERGSTFGLWLRLNGTDFQSAAANPADGSTSYSGAIVQSGVNVKLYMNKTQVLNTNTAQTNPGLDLPQFSRQSSGRDAIGGNWEAVYIWNRAITEREYLTLVNDAWCIWNRRLNFSYAGAAGGTGTLKTHNTLTRAQLKTYAGLAIGSVKTIDGLTT